MARIRCTLPNASDLISGVRFTPAGDGRGVVSDLLEDETAARFLAIPGYEPVKERGQARPAAPDAPPTVAELPPPPGPERRKL